jgi:L-malate glycosyltransferase
MKIANVIDALTRGGADRQALNAVLALTRMGADAELVHYYGWSDELRAYDHPALKECRVTCLPRGKGGLGFVRRLRGYLATGGFDVVHGFKGTSSVYACLAGRLAGVRAVLAGYRGQYEERRFTRVAHRVIDRLAAGWVVNSRAIAASLVRGIGADEKRVHVVYNGLDFEGLVSPLTGSEARCRLGLEQTARTVTMIAQLRPEKNHLMFLEVAAAVLVDCPAARFLLAGDGRERPAVEQRARSLGIADAVLLLGNRADVPDILAASEVSVLTSPREGLSNALLESMATGKPVVSTAYPGVEELVTDGQEGFVVPCGDAQAMARAVIRLLADSELRQRIGQQGRKTAETRFSLDAMGSSLLGVYSRCLGEAN